MRYNTITAIFLSLSATILARPVPQGGQVDPSQLQSNPQTGSSQFQNVQQNQRCPQNLQCSQCQGQQGMCYSTEYAQCACYDDQQSWGHQQSEETNGWPQDQFMQSGRDAQKMGNQAMDMNPQDFREHGNQDGGQTFDSGMQQTQQTGGGRSSRQRLSSNSPGQQGESSSSLQQSSPPDDEEHEEQVAKEFDSSLPQNGRNSQNGTEFGDQALSSSVQAQPEREDLDSTGHRQNQGESGGPPQGVGR